MATTEPDTLQLPGQVNETEAWSPCYVCFQSGGTESYSSLVVFKLLMHEIWMWENEMADIDQAVSESETGLCAPERVPPESELLPCHYFDFFYGASHGGVIATLLGRLRLRVDDATERFRKIHHAYFGRKRLLNQVLLPRRVLGMKFHITTSLENAVYNTARERPINPNDRGGTDQLFRDPTLVSMSPLKPGDPRQAQTCILIADLYDGTTPYTSHILRTFTCGDEHPYDQGVPFANRLNLTICQLLRSTMRAPVIGIEDRIEIAREETVTGSYTVRGAVEDYEHLYPKLASLRYRRPSMPESIVLFRDRHTIDVHALFLNIAWFKTSEIRGTSKSLAISKSVFSPIDAAHGNDSLHRQKMGMIYVRWQSYNELVDGFSKGQGLDINAPNFEAVYAHTVDAVNKKLAFRSNLRRIAKTLVGRRRARQAMGGPRWEAFAGNAAQANGGKNTGEA